MRILGIESSSLVASAAIVTDDILTAEYTVNFKKTHSQTLLPMIDEIVTMTETELGSIDAIAVSGGPGSFTGLRIGSATAKGLGLALKKPLIHVPTVDALAYNLWGAKDLVCPIMDAKRNQVYTGIYRMRGGMEAVKAQCAMDMGQLMEERSPSVFFSTELCAHYFTYMSRENGAHFVLFDDAGSIRKKMQVAGRLGIRQAVLAYPQVEDLLEAILANP